MDRDTKMGSGRQNNCSNGASSHDVGSIINVMYFSMFVVQKGYGCEQQVYETAYEDRAKYETMASENNSNKKRMLFLDGQQYSTEYETPIANRTRSQLHVRSASFPSVCSKVVIKHFSDLKSVFSSFLPEYLP